MNTSVCYLNKMNPQQDLFASALKKFSGPPTDGLLIKKFFDMIMLLFTVINQPNMIRLIGTYVVTTDPMEDSDDEAMWLFCFLNTMANLIVIISEGHQTSEVRLEYMKASYPTIFGNAEFDKPIYRSDGSWIIFKQDGCTIDVPINGYVNAGPCHSTTLKTIGLNLVKSPETRVITVGAVDGTCLLGAGINQKQTDTSGTLTNIQGVWNDFITQCISFGITCKNLSVDISRYVLFPNPKTMSGTPYAELMGNQEAMKRFIAVVGMFIASRPPAKFAQRVNEGNSIICLQYRSALETFIQDILAGNSNPIYEMAFNKLQNYMDQCTVQDVSIDVAEAAAIPIVFTHLLGGVYKEGQFGWAPTDHEAKMTAACLTPESAQIFKANISELPFLTPMYDVCAFLMLLSDFDADNTKNVNGKRHKCDA